MVHPANDEAVPQKYNTQQEVAQEVAGGEKVSSCLRSKSIVTNLQ